jgi:hypothetical protein
VSDPITPTDISRLASNESIISAVLKWAAANGRRLSKADLERMGQGVDAMVEENARITKERDDWKTCANLMASEYPHDEAGGLVMFNALKAKEGQ